MMLVSRQRHRNAKVASVGWPNSSRTPLKTPLSESCNVTNLTDVFKHSELEDDFKLPLPLDSFSFVTLRAGKLWRKSLRDHRRYSVLNSKSPAPVSQRRQSMRIVPVVSNVTSRKTSILQDYAKTILTEDSEVDASVRPQSPLIITAITAKDLVLQKCRQSEPMPFEKCYPESLLRDCRKIGEGAYGEVFLYRNPDGSSTVMKVIPIEGATEINGDRQKKFDEILSEIVISSELSGLRQGVVNQSSAFAEVKRICCVYGKYPERLLALWDEFDVEKGSENDRPEMFDESQLYIVLDLANAGADLEAFQFNNAAQALSMVRQVACALAVAEQRLKFEHRDLHWGNVLLEGVSRNTKLSYKLKDKRNEIQTRGVRATIIDFTLSRIEHDGVVIYNDLGQDPELFVAQGDYQFEVYRLMRRRNGNDWEKFEPYSNTLWLHYIVDKSITALRYKNVNTKVHKDNIDKLKEIRDTILDYDCATNFIESLF
ncbi:serine/threonine-protein kinase haspin homolog isoform X2 [Cylas formicarius]|uniref:serine/threonine-protein kinase haspin homolog isoform X2 n=1 Tax=Cylas formicarius TaxID=197179 RepID=UPI002958A8BE|nr:serine/threonine-protein kinase haspin homolog isoform X2 [Cylas formicarius]